MIQPLSIEEIGRIFDEEHGSINKHLLTIYSIVAGLQAKRAAEIGVGYTTGVIRAALQKTGGELFTCDWDKEKWREIMAAEQDPNLHFTGADSKTFINSLQGPFDFILHDGAHDLWQVAWDLEHLWPMLRQFGIICIHDTQHNMLGRGMHEAIKKGFQNCPVSLTHLPYGYGFTIVRIEKKQPFPAVETTWHKKDYEGRTLNETCGITDFAGGKKRTFLQTAADALRYLKWRVFHIQK